MNATSQITANQTSVSQISAANRQPRKRPAPSLRDQQIYLDYQAYGKRQIDLADEYGLNQSRISQIIRRVDKWLHAAPDQQLETDDLAARRRLRRTLQSERLNNVSRLALRHYSDFQKAVTYKSGKRNGQDFSETTERILPPNLQCLKVVLQANSQLSRLDPLPPLDPRQTDDLLTDQQQREEVEAWLTQQHKEAQRAGLVPIEFGTNILVRDLVSTFLGQPNRGVALQALASASCKKIVDRNSYDDNPPQLPPRGDGWYYRMHDADGSLVAWIHESQLAGAISPDYPPVQAPSPDAAPEANSTTTPHSADSSQPACSPALTSPSPQIAIALNDQSLSDVMKCANHCGVV